MQFQSSFINYVKYVNENIKQNAGKHANVGIIDLVSFLRADELREFDHSAMSIEYISIEYTTKPLIRLSVVNQSFIFTETKDGKILWLDNHLSDNDFTMFMLENEDWWVLVSEPFELANWLLQTRFHFLPLPVLLKNISDIPTKTKVLREEQFKHQIRTPNIVRIENSKFTCHFSVWTREYGTLLNITCNISKGQFIYTIEQLATNIGNYVIRM